MKPLVAVAALLCLVGCITPAQRREEEFIRQARTFNDDLRWGRYEQLTASLPRDEARLFLERVNAVEDELVMADFEVTSITFGAGREKAAVVVKFDWYSRRAPTLKSTTLEQRWEYQGRRWLCIKQRRSRGDRFPLVTEPAKMAEPSAAGP